MSRVRVSELAKELGLETKVVLAHFTKLGIQIKNHLSMVSEEDIAKLKSFLQTGKSADKDAQKYGNKIFIRRKVVEVSPPKADEEHPSAIVEETASLPEESVHSEPDNFVSETKSDTPKELSVEQGVSLESSEVALTSSTLPTVNPTDSIVIQHENTLQSAAKNIEEPNALPAPASKGQTDTLRETPTVVAPETVLPRVTPARPSSSVSATIVRRAQENVYQVNMARTSRNEPSYQSYGTKRPTDPKAPIKHGPYVPQQQKSFVMPDSVASTGTKDSSDRFKDRGKEREKRKTNHDESRNYKNQIKGARFYEKNDLDDISVFSEDDPDRELLDSAVRTMVSAKKYKPAFKRKSTPSEVHTANPTKASKKIIRIDDHISVNDLAGELSQKSGVIIKTLMKLGMLATANKVLDFDTASLVAHEFGFETQNVSVSLEDIIAQKSEKQQVDSVAAPRPPIITIMGHVDHGKTSLLDALRHTNVASSEAGGITQHIGAYQIDYHGRQLTFLDTPGHEAFTAMRARGAKVTDIIILVVAADDGVMPQTIEAIAHAKAASVPIIVAINKIDKPNINIDRITRELSENGVMSEEWGGDSIFVQVSAKTQEGLNKLIEAILLQADLLDLKAQPTGFAEGVVIEAKRDKARGPVATVIVTKGLLKQQDSIVIGKTMGRVRAMYDDKGESLKEALPGTPVELLGLDNVPEAGDAFNAVASDAIAREAVAYRVEKHRQAVLASQKPTSMSDLMVMLEQRDSQHKAIELPVIIKTDTHGSAEAIKVSLQKLDTPKVKTKVILAAVGGITETDVVLADASRAIILGFNVRPDKIAAQRAESSGIKIMFFNIIYELIDAVKIAMVGTLAPIKQDKIIGHAEVRTLFTVPKVGVIAGSFVTDGKITRPCKLHIVRSGVVTYTGHLGSLKRFKEDAKEVAHGFECGIGVENYNDLKVGDVLEAFVIEEIAAEL